jgi:ribosomal protein S18 acetylase RimI-like enzyme
VKSVARNRSPIVAAIIGPANIEESFFSVILQRATMSPDRQEDRSEAMANPEQRPATPHVTFRPARSAEAAELARLVNSAYRGDSSRAGWTTEADLLDGQRTDEEEIRELITAKNSLLLICLRDAEIIGSVSLQKTGNTAYLGMLVIRPDWQGAGVGRRLIQAAENFVRQEWGAHKIEMTVITLRTELLAFYERRGYRRTGVIKPFPTDVRAGIPRVRGLEFEVLENNTVDIF